MKNPKEWHLMGREHSIRLVRASKRPGGSRVVKHRDPKDRAMASQLLGAPGSRGFFDLQGL